MDPSREATSKDRTRVPRAVGGGVSRRRREVASDLGGDVPWTVPEVPGVSEVTVLRPLPYYLSHGSGWRTEGEFGTRDSSVCEAVRNFGRSERAKRKIDDGPGVGVEV